MIFLICCSSQLKLTKGAPKGLLHNTHILTQINSIFTCVMIVSFHVILFNIKHDKM